MSVFASPPGPQSGLTLIEIIVVLIIFSLGWFALLPAMSPDEEAAPRLEAVNAMLRQARSQAMSSAKIQSLEVRLGGGVVAWDDQVEKLPSSVEDCQINGRTSLSRRAVFRIYPAGSMDELRLSLNNGEVLQAAPLTAVLAAAR